MKIVENNVKRGEIIIFDYKVSFKFCPCDEEFFKKLCPGSGVFERKIQWSGGQPGGIVTGQGDTFISSPLFPVALYESPI